MQYVINKAATPYLNHVGQLRTPVFVLDNFLENLADTLLKEVDSLVFDNAPTYYPGIRAKLPEQYVLSVVQALLPLMKKIYSIPSNYTVHLFDSYFCLVTRKPEELSLEQQIPHFDGTDSFRFALLHYLNPNAHGGTAFYRHDKTGIERVDEQNVESFLTDVSKQMNQNGAPAGRYFNDSSQQFTKVGEIPYVQNRFAIYPGNFLHSGAIQPATDIDPNPKTGRLTANIFLKFTPE